MVVCVDKDCTVLKKERCFPVTFSVYFQIKVTLCSPVKSVSVSNNLALPACLCPAFDIILWTLLFGNVPEEKKWVILKPSLPAPHPYHHPSHSSLSPKLALIRFSEGFEDWSFFLCVWLQCHQQRFGAVKPLLLWKKVVIVLRKQDSMGNRYSAYDLRHFPLHSFTTFIVHWHRSINQAYDYYITKDITAQLYCSRY